MAVLTRVIGENDSSDEYLAAVKLKEIIDTTVPKNALGEIILFPSATLYGQAVKDVDIMMIGNMKNYSVPVTFSQENQFIEDDVYLESFCTTVEVKSHPISGIRKEGTNLQVFYHDTGWHNATKQSNEQKKSAMHFFENSLGSSPYITNLIWFVEVSDNELNSLLSYKDNTMPSNALPNTFDFQKVVQLLAYQRVPRKRNNCYSIESSFGGNSSDNISKPLQLFSKVKSGIGELTRRKIEQITTQEFGEIGMSISEDKFNILRGRAGTGKTVDLIRYAIRLVDEKGVRVQILTYNRALVSDIRRLFTLADLPDMFESRCVSINTMQSFFYGIINGCLYDGSLSGEDFLRDYDQMMAEIIEFLKSDKEAKNIIHTICEDNPKLNWNYILIDEAQDWTEKEKELILLLYDNDHIMVADGGSQYVRTINPCDWSVVSNRNNIKLKSCLRQKRNIVKFVNMFSSRISSSYNPITPSEEMIGGKIIVITDEKEFYHTIKIEREAMRKAGNDCYDMLFLVPANLVDGGDKRSFKLIKEFEKKDILLWDGTNDDNRLEYSVDTEESRVLQYESARGLEGWTVCCMDFDIFLENKINQYTPDIVNDALMLESAEEKKSKYLMNWALIPLTRAIDTLIITLKDKDAMVSELILELAGKYPDYIQII